MRTMGILVAVAALCLAGCATTPISPADATPVPAPRLLAYQQPGAGLATIVVTRDTGIIDSACYVSLTIDKKLAARFGTGEVARFHVEPGAVLFRVGNDPDGHGLCTLGQDDWTERQMIIGAGDVMHFRLSTDGNGKHDIEPTD